MSWDMYVCMYVCIYIYIHTHSIYIYIYILYICAYAGQASLDMWVCLNMGCTPQRFFFIWNSMINPWI